MLKDSEFNGMIVIRYILCNNQLIKLFLFLGNDLNNALTSSIRSLFLVGKLKRFLKESHMDWIGFPFIFRLYYIDLIKEENKDENALKEVYNISSFKIT